jgi:hypothetical protein
MSLLTSASTWDTSDLTSDIACKRRKKCTTFQETVDKQEESKKRINDLLNNMQNVSPDNDGSSLGAFQSPEPALIMPTKISQQQQIQRREESSSYLPTDTNVKEGFALASSYAESYNGKILSEAMKPYLMKGDNHELNTYANDKLVEKLNYLIHLIEEQKHEPTQHVTEEFLLYTFLGVFIIYIVDAFSRAGKYIR